MAVTVENGSGVFGANSYVLATYVSAYLTDRNRETENGWANGAESTEEDAAVVEATDYIESRYRDLFQGQKQFRDIRVARATLTFTGQPADTETVTIGTTVYQFVTTLAAANDVQISTASLSETIDNLVDAINASASTAGTAYEATTVEHPDASAQAFYMDSMLLFSDEAGTPGNAIVTTTTVALASWNFATLVGGADLVTPQPLSFPRLYLYDRDGIVVVGVPERLKFAAAEYAVRARATGTVLSPDPTIDTLGGAITMQRFKVSTLEKETRYDSGTTGDSSLPSYPSADLLLAEYLIPSGVVRA